MEAPTSLPTGMAKSSYVAYPYAYPHKTAYRPLAPPVPLHDLWAGEDRRALFLYLHVPFCRTRCGYCNLFTLANPGDGLRAAYLAALGRQARQVSTALGQASFARLAIGGGTPTHLDLADLRALFDLVEEVFGVDPRTIPVSVETSPATAEEEKLRLLRRRGTDRISLGVQSFVEAEVVAAGRRQTPAGVERALNLIRAVGFPILNVDLIYGLPGQTVESWCCSLRAALRFAPEELYLYPLYVRPLTGLDRAGRSWEDVRLACYRAGRALLLEAGYTQLSMRMFRAPDPAAPEGPVYRCQEDGMVGLGTSARSYTQACHYASEYATSRAGVRAILEAYVRRPAPFFARAHHGFLLDPEEQRRRYVIKSLLRAEGLDLAAYRAFFGTRAGDDLVQLADLVAHGLATQAGNRLRLTEAGLERSDGIGPWLYSARVRRLMREYAPG